MSCFSYALMFPLIIPSLLVLFIMATFVHDILLYAVLCIVTNYLFFLS